MVGGDALDLGSATLEFGSLEFGGMPCLLGLGPLLFGEPSCLGCGSSHGLRLRARLLRDAL